VLVVLKALDDPAIAESFVPQHRIVSAASASGPRQHGATARRSPSLFEIPMWGRGTICINTGRTPAWQNLRETAKKTLKRAGFNFCSATSG